MSFEHARVDTNINPTVCAILGIFAISTSFLILPFAIFNVYHFNRLKRSNILKKRYVSLVVASSIFMIIWVSTATQFYFIQNLFHYLISPMTSTILKALNVFIYPYASHCSLWLILTRFWLTYFDFSWTKATLNAEWKVHIDPQGSSKNEQWFLMNKAKYGNLQFMRRKAWIISLCIATVSMLAFQFSVFSTFATTTQMQALDFLFYIIPTIILLILWKKIPPVYDILFYRQEMKKLGFTALACLVNYFGVIAVGLLLRDDVITSFYGGMSQLFYTYSFILYQTTWVLYKIKRSNMHMGRTYNRENSHTVYSSSRSEPEYTQQQHSLFRMRSHSTRRERDKAAMLPVILSNKQSFNLFMQHLSAEFSMECLLAFTEFTQYRMMLEKDVTFMRHIDKTDINIKIKQDLKTDQHKNELHVQLNDEKTECDEDKNEIELGKVWDDSDPSTPKTPCTPITPKMGSAANQSFNPIGFAAAIPDKTILQSKSLRSKRHPYKTVKLPNKIPQSFIVYQDRAKLDGNEKYLQIATDLFRKYVKIGSEFEINVSYGMRYGVQHIIEKSGPNGNIESNLYELFESSRKELYILMSHACQRFVDTAKYKSIEHELITNKFN